MTEDETQMSGRREFLRETMATAVGVGIAGCSTRQLKTLRSTPIGLKKEAVSEHGFSEGSVEAITVSSSDLGFSGGDLADVNVTSHVATYTVGALDRAGKSESEDLTLGWEVEDERARILGVLSTPAINLGGKKRNPLASKSLPNILTSKRGRDLLRRTGLFGNESVHWTSPPEQVGRTSGTVVNQKTTVETYLGKARGGDSDPWAVLVHMARVFVDGDAIIAAITQWRQSSAGGPDSPPSSPPSNERLSTIQKDTVAMLKALGPNPAFDVALDTPMVALHNGRLVQKSMNTRVVDRSGKQPSVLHKEPEPPLVVGDQTGLLFDWTGGSLDTLGRRAADINVHVVIWDETGSLWTAFSFDIPAGNLQYVIDGSGVPATLFSSLVDYGEDIETFSLDATIQKVSVSLSSPDIIGDTITLQRGKDFEQKQLRPLRIGFVEVIDPDTGANFGNGNGRVEKYSKTVKNTVEYIKRVFPGQLVAYRMDRPLRGARNTSTYAETITYTKAQVELNRTAMWVHRSLGNEGTLVEGAPDPQTALAVLQRDGFDVVVAVLPNGYYTYHNAGNLSGFAPSHKSQSVSMLGQTQRRYPQETAPTGAQEVAHRLAGSPYRNPGGCHTMSQRDEENFSTRLKGSACKNEPVDFEHARHESSYFEKKPDKPGVVSVPFDFSNGKFNVVKGLGKDSNGDLIFETTQYIVAASLMESYMSYTDDTPWADSRITRKLIDSGFDVNSGYIGGARGKEDDTQPEPVLSLAGGVNEDGTVAVEYLLPYDGFPSKPNVPEKDDAAGADISFYDPTGERLQTTAVSTVDEATHRDPIKHVVSATLPVPDRAITVHVEFRGDRIDQNLVTDPLRFALDRVSDGRIPGGQDELRTSLNNVGTAMESGSYGQALATLRKNVRPALKSVVASESNTLGEPSRDDLELLLGRGIDRLLNIQEN